MNIRIDHLKVHLRALLRALLRGQGEKAARRGCNILQRGMDHVFPAHCPVTEERVAGDGEISGSGWQKLSFISTPLCDLCGIPFQITPLESPPAGDNAHPAADSAMKSADPRSLICAPCSLRAHDHRGLTRALVSRDGVDRARAALIYNDASASLVLKLKYADRHDLIRPLGAMMIRAARDLLHDSALLITPVPLHRARLRARRFNQAALLGDFIARQSGHRYMPELLIRHRKTPPQKGLAVKARIRNVSAAFHAQTACLDTINGADILLIDDVLTTGATVKACARVLKNAGARSVNVLTIARVVDQPLMPGDAAF